MAVALLLSCYLSGALSGLLPTRASAMSCTVSWAVDADGFWDDPANWDTGSVPGYNDDVCIDRPAGAFTITIRQSAGTVGSVQSAETLRVITNGLLKVRNPSSISGGLQLEVGTLGTQSYATWTISGSSLWSEGTLTGNGIITNTGTLTMTNPVTRTLSTRLDNAGTIVHSGSGNLSISSGKQVNNLAGALYDFQGDGDIIGYGQFNNSGTLRKSAGSGESRFSSNTYLNNLAGTIEVQTGQLTWGRGTSIGGTFNVSAGATLDLTGGGSPSYAGTYTGSGDGQVLLASGTLNVSSSGATFNFPEGLLHWSGGVINTYGTVFTNIGTVLITGEVGVGRGEFRNFGTVRHQGPGNLNLNWGAWGVSGTFVNEAGALYDLESDADVLGGTFVNIGTLRKSGGSGESSFGKTFNNQKGIIDVQVGTINLAGSGTSTGGTFNVEAGGVLEISRDLVSNGAQDWTGTYTGSGAGTVRHRGYLRGDNDDPPVLNFPQGMFQWTGGFIYGGTLINEGYLQLSGDEDKYFRAHLINRGTIVHTGNGNLRQRIDAQFDNEGLYDLQGDADILQWEDQYTGSAPFYNAGVFRKSGGSGISEFDKTANFWNRTVFSNTGTVEVLAGTLSIARQEVPVQGGVLTAGTWKVAPFATLTFPNAGDVETNRAAVILQGSASQFPNLSTLAHNEGSFTITDGHDFTTAGDLANSGTLTIGPDSTLTVSGVYTEANPNSLTVQIGDSPTSGQYGQVNVTGQAVLTGTLHVELVNGYGPLQGETYQVMSYAGRSGQFDPITGLYPFFQASQTDSSIVLTAAGSAADLEPWTLVDMPDTAAPGQEVTLSYTVSNRKDQAVTGSWTDSLYLSTDWSYSPDDLLIGRVQHTGGIGAYGSYSGTLTAPLPGAVDGDYQVIVIADTSNVVPDADRANNAAASSGQLTVQVPFLPFNTPTAGTIADGQDIYYRLDLPVGGGDVLLTANFDAVLEAELFVRYDALPTRSQFDFTASNLLELERHLVLPSPEARPLYILLHGREGGESGRGYELTAENVALALRSVYPRSGSNQGQATLRLNGGGFSGATAVSLLDGTGSPVADAQVQVESSGLLFATFDLTGVAPGVYDVRATNGADTATLPAAFQVIADWPGQLQIHVQVPGRVRGGSIYHGYIWYSNVGGTDLTAPLIFVSSPSHSPFTTDESAPPSNIRMQFLAYNPDGPAGVLPPGAKGSIPLRIRARSSSNEIVAEYADVHNTSAMDWERLRRDLYQFEQDNPRFPEVFAQMVAQVGPTMGDYVAMLAHNATLLPPQLGEPWVVNLVALELRKAEAAISTSISGRLSTTDPGVQIRGVKVIASNLDTQEAFTTISLNDGSFIFENVTPGSYEFLVQDAAVTSPPSGTITVAQDQVLTGVVVTVVPGVDVVGYVLNSSGNAVPLARLYVYQGDTSVRFTAANTQGAYQLNDLTPGTYTFVAIADGYARTWLTDVPVAGRWTTVNIPVNDQAAISGIATLPTGVAADLLVFANLRATLPITSFSAQGDAVGAFTLGGLPPGTYDLALVSGTSGKLVNNVTVGPGQHLDLGQIILDEGGGAQAAASLAAAPASSSDFDLEFQLALSEDFINRVWIPAAFSTLGRETASLWALFVNGSSANPPARQLFNDGDQVVEGHLFVRGFRDSVSLDRQNLSAIRSFALVDIRRMFRQGDLNCDEVVQQRVTVLPLESLPSIASRLELDTNYDQITEIAGNLAGGIGPAWPPDNPHGGAYGQEFPDRRYLSGVAAIFPHGPDSVKVDFIVDMNVEDTIDFLPGDPGTGLEQQLTTHLIFLEGHDRAYDVPFSVQYDDEDDFPSEILTFPGHDDCDDPEPEECPDCQPGGSGSTGIIIAMDPNEKLTAGAFNSGGGMETHYIPADSPIPYTIHFENLPSATAPAAQVVVTDVLDANLDLASFELGVAGFGDQVVQPPAGRDYYSARLDLTGELGVLVDVEASLDLDTRQARWVFTAIDPQTGDLVADPLAGFLPPNDASGKGEGFVTFCVRPTENLTSGTSITNAASIVFDFNPPIVTNVVTNTIDADPPTSSVDPLPASSGPIFPVTWSGDDDAGSGIAFYDLFVSDDGGPFVAWQTGITATTAIFTGTLGHTYAFYSVATDHVGYRQPTPSAAQATTTASCLDLTGDRQITVLDIQAVAEAWHQSPGAPFDIDNDGQITARDILLVAARFSESCP